MKIKKVLVSIIINCHNGEKYLREALLSLKNQKYKYFEVIFWDNNSSDNSKKIYLNFADKRFKYFSSNKKLKLCQARNLALSKCSGDLITFLDTDDIWLKNKLLEEVSEYKKNKFDILYSSYYIKNKISKKLRLKKVKSISSDYQNHYLKNYDVALVTICINKESFKKKNTIFDSNYNIIGDFVFMMKMSKFSKISILKKPLAIYRVHNNNYTNQNYFELGNELRLWVDKNKKLQKLSNFRYFYNRLLYYESLGEFDNRRYYNFIKIIFRIIFTTLFIKAIYHIFKKNFND